MDEANKMEIISQLMEELQDLMGPSSGDFEERLGRPKPEMEIKVESEGAPMESDMGDGMEDEGFGSPEDKFKNRLMKLRG
jgi:hypothetical protein